jgi:hypothetical protein
MKAVSHSTAPKSQFYVLCRPGQEPNRVVNQFRSAFEAERYGTPRGFTAAIGPFETRFAAELMAEFGQANPHMQTAEDSERIAQSLIEEASEAIERQDEIVYDVASDSGQIVGNVKHMEWFRHAVALAIFEERP